MNSIFSSPEAGKLLLNNSAQLRFRAGKSALLLILTCFFSLILSAQTTWFVKTSGNDAAAGTGWATAFKTVEKALSEVVAGDNIWVAAGTYKPAAYPTGCLDCTTNRDFAFNLPENVNLYGGFSGVENSLSQRNIPANATIFSGDIGVPNDKTDNTYHVLISYSLNAAGGNTKIDGITIMNGNADLHANITLASGSILIHQEDGGGLYLFNTGTSFLTITNCVFASNTVLSYGGGIYNDFSSPVISNSVFSRNSAASGGGFYNIEGSPSLANDVFTSNTATSLGEAMNQEFGFSSSVISNCTFSGNSGIFGVTAIYIGQNFTSTFRNCVFWGNNTVQPGLEGIATHVANSSATVSNSSGEILYPGTGNISGDPQFLNSANPKGADNLWMTADDGLQLGCNSPAIDRGNLAAAPLVDIAGVSRPQRSTADMGAYEQQPFVTSTVQINSPSATVCTGSALLFTATGTNGGSAPSFQWKKNNVNVGSNSNTYTDAALLNNDVISCTFSSSASCPVTNPVVSNNIAITVSAANIPRLYVNQQATGLNTGLSWTDAYTDLQSALSNTCLAANAEIWVAAGLYHPDTFPTGCLNCSSPRDYSFLLPQGIKIYGGFAGTETLLAERNPHAQNTTLSGDIGIAGDASDNSYHVVLSLFNNISTLLDGFTIKDGHADGTGSISINGNTYAQNTGAGVILVNSAVTLNNNRITANISGGSGGGLFNLNTQYPAVLTPVITNCSFDKNAAANGGGINNLFSSPVITNCSFASNTASVSGSSIANADFSSPQITNCTFTLNTNGPAGSCLLNESFSSPSVKNCILWNNPNATTTPVINTTGSAPLITYSLVQGGYAGTGNLNTDPLFVNGADPLGADNLFATADDGLQLSCQSPAFNTASATGIPPTDILSNPRPSLGGADMGAYELQTQVINNRYYVNAAATGANNGLTWKDAFTNLQSALTNSCISPGTEIWVAEGLYKPVSNVNQSVSFTIPSGVKVYGAFPSSGNPLFTDRNISLYETILSGDLNGNHVDDYGDSYQVVTFIDVSAQTVLDGVTIEHGYANQFGGGIVNFATAVNTSSSPQIANCTVRHNYAGFAGGGMYCSGYGAMDINFLNCKFENNSTPSSGAGIALNSLSAGIAYHPVFTNCTFSGNNAGGRGGAILNAAAGASQINMVMKNCLFLNNQASQGGAIANVTDPNVSVISLNVINGIFDHNSATNSGGAVYDDNSHQQLPAISTAYVNCTFTSNQAVFAGGAAFSVIDPLVTPSYTNCIFWNNSAPADAALNYSAGFITLNNCDIQDAALPGNNNISIDPQFVNLLNPSGSDNIPGTTDDGLQLSLCSPLINLGDNTINNSMLDVTGQTRVFNSGIDLGAYEFQSIPDGSSLAIHNDQKTIFLSPGISAFITPSCRIIARIEATGGSPVSGSITAKNNLDAFIQQYNGEPYVQRHVDLEPALNPGNATATVTLFFSQGEFDAFNAVRGNYPALPSGPADISGIANLKVTQYHGNSPLSIPGSYSGLSEFIDPDDANITWNSGQFRWEIKFDVTGFSGFFVHSGFNPLPLTLLKFTGSPADHANMLNWITTSEPGTTAFEVQRSVDGNNFTTIGKVDARENPAAQQEYSFADTDPGSLTADRFYRLKLPETGGSFTVSKIIKIKRNPIGQISFFPNPFRDHFTVEINTQKQDNLILVFYDITGKEIFQKKITIKKGNNLVDIYPGKTLAPGTYLIRISSSSQNQLFKIIKE